MIKVNSRVTINKGLMQNLSRAAVVALEKTAEALHTEVVQAQVMPRDTGALQNEKTHVDYSEAENGTVSIVSEGPYARRLYFHPEYHFQKIENPNAKGKWYEDWEEGGSKENFAPAAFRKFFKREAGL